MPNRVAVNTLNASTIDILNTIRANASYEYQSLVPEISRASEIPRVGEVLYGYPALANQFINALINRIALVRVKSATFNNAYAELKKGYLEFGETVEEVFVNIAKAREFSVEKAASREFKRTLPDVRTAFHAMNWNVQYPVTIQDEDLRMAFQSINGVQDLIAKIVDSVYTAAEYDEYLLFKYLLIKAVTKGKCYLAMTGDPYDAAMAFRAFSNKLTFMTNKYNSAGVHTVTPREDQRIFMDALYNAAFDVEVLSSAFNMDKATFFGKLTLIDDWSTFDNDRFNEIRANSDMIEEVTEQELAYMSNVRAIIVDEEWFQVYDNMMKFTECYVSSGMYWNYNLNIRKTVSSSPFSNIVVFMVGMPDEQPDSIQITVVDKSVNENTTVMTVGVVQNDVVSHSTNYEFVQNENATAMGVAVHKYGVYIFGQNVNVEPMVREVSTGAIYTVNNPDLELSPTYNVGATFTLDRVD